MSESCPSCGHVMVKASRVSIYGMYDRHLFHSIKGKTVEEVISNWIAHNSGKIPAIVGDRPVDDMGPSSLCPAIVLDGDKELRRVGDMVFADYGLRRGQPKEPLKLEAYREALLNDPDIPRLLATALP